MKITKYCYYTNMLCILNGVEAYFDSDLTQASSVLDPSWYFICDTVHTAQIPLER